MLELSFTPDLIPKATLFHVIQKPRLDQLLRFHLLGPLVGLRRFLEDRLKGFRFERQARLQDLDFSFVGSVDDRPVVDAQRLVKTLRPKSRSLCMISEAPPIARKRCAIA